jgi:small subunit ribosomal protein S20
VANHASSKKRIRQTERRTTRNKHVRTTTRTVVKRVRAALASEDVQAAEQHLASARQLIDRAVRKGVYHWKTGARYVSRLTAQVDALKRA